MDDEQLQSLLALVVDEDAPAATAELGRRLFDLLPPAGLTAELAELAVETEHPRPDTDADTDTTDGDGDAPDRGPAWPDRTLVFAGPTRSVAVALDAARHRAAGQIEPPRAATASLRQPTGDVIPVTIDRQGRFALEPVPAGPLQLVIDAENDPGSPTDADDGTAGPLRTAWCDWLDQPATATPAEPATDRPAAGLGDLVARRLARRASDALDGLRPTGTARTSAGPADQAEPGDTDRSGSTTAPATGLPGRFDPPVATVTRTLAAAAQQGLRRLPAHRWDSDDDRLTVVLAEGADGLLTLTATGDADVQADTVLIVGWTITGSDGDTRDDHLVTPLPLEATERRQSAYEVGSALDLRSFHLRSVDLVPTDRVTPDEVTRALAHRAYGNAIRAWGELLDRHPAPDLRAAFDRALGQL